MFSQSMPLNVIHFKSADVGEFSLVGIVFTQFVMSLTFFVSMSDFIPKTQAIPSYQMAYFSSVEIQTCFPFFLTSYTGYVMAKWQISDPHLNEFWDIFYSFGVSSCLSEFTICPRLSGSFHFSFFGQRYQKRKNQLFCLFIL